MHAILGLAVYPLAGRLADAWGGRRVLALGACAQAVKFLALFAAPTPALAAAASMLPMFPLVTTGSAAAIAETSHTPRRAGGMGIITGTLAAGAAVGPVAGGLAVDAIGLRVAPLLAGVLALTTASLAARAGFFAPARRER
jgi:predicted MFS family arabinose efflux permease